ncbi:hypothetical protein QUF84_00575 [Fictibacillus enclensis]|uniref:hypothetical protein n=1 Tax=Fictibacillus enclensis TaxID=1017270 RepID=UPI0025A1E38F|nr:hypothetical protein [Fictibacillus enclensis]MDM5335791.1 hypothetical protein [Fictibacillus enclensis]
MLRDYPYIIGIMFLGIFLVVISGIYYQKIYKQDSVVMGLTETVRTSAIKNADNSSRLRQGELFIEKSQFEQDFKQKMARNQNVKLSDAASYQFKYLDNANGATKAIRVFIKDGDVTYQATAKVSIAGS